MSNFNMSEWKGRTKMLTLVAAIIALVAGALTVFFNITIPGLTPIAVGITAFGLGLKELNEFKETQGKFELVLGITLIATFGLGLYAGILQFNHYIFSLVRM